MIRLKKNITLIIFFFPIVLIGQYTLKVNVVSEEENLPLQNVELYHKVEGKIYLSDAKGFLQIDDLAKAKHEFLVFREDFDILNKEIDLDSDTTILIQLRSLSVALNAIEIAERKKEIFQIRHLKDVEGTAIYAGKKSEVVLMDLVRGNVAINQARQVYAQVSGLNIYEGSDGGLQLNLGGRGLDPNRTSNFNTRQNGYDISADVLGYPENYYTPPTEALEEIRIVRGASSLQYGTQFGGLIDFRIKKAPNFKKFDLQTSHTIGSYGLYSSLTNFGVNRSKVSVNGFYQYKRGNGFRENSQFKSNNLWLAVDYKLSTQTNVEFEFTYFNYLAKQAGGLTDQQFEIDPQMSTRSRNWFGVDWKLYNLEFIHEFKKDHKISLSLFALDAARNALGFRGNPSNLNENPITALDEQDLQGQFILPRDLIKGTFRNAGFEFRYIQPLYVGEIKSIALVGQKLFKAKNASIQGPGSNGVDPEFSFSNELYPDYPSQSNFLFPNFNYSAFAENIFYLNPRFSITPGIRWEYIKTQSEGNYNQVIFDNAGNPIANNLLTDDRLLERNFLLLGIGIQHKKSENFQCVFNFSQNYRSVTFSDIRTVSPTFVIDPDIKDETGFTADFGIKGRYGKYLSYDLSTYGILYDNRIGIILDDRANRIRKNIGKALIGGLESLLTFNPVRFINDSTSLWSTNMFVNMAITTSRYIESEESNVVGKQVEFIPLINLKTGVDLAYKRTQISAQYSFISKQYTDVQNSSIAPAGDNRSGIIGEIPAYQIFDLHLSHNLDRVEISAGVNNLFDAAYFTRRATGYPGPGIIPSTGRNFYFGVNWKL